MAERVAGPEIERLIQLLARLPGLGPRSARRAALHLIRRREELLGPLSDALATARTAIKTCSTCGNVDTLDPCTVCRDPRRDPEMLVVVETVGDLWALERAAGRRRPGPGGGGPGGPPSHASSPPRVARGDTPVLRPVRRYAG